MSASGGMSQLLKGIIIGVVLIMAIIGTMSLLEKDSLVTPENTTQSSNLPTKDINAPNITLNPDVSNEKPNKNNNDDNPSNIGDLNAEIVDEKENLVISDENNKPILEGERTPEVASASTKPTISYGMMVLKAINPNNNKALKANYAVFDKNNTKVAESKNVGTTSYRLPTGQYKVETTLTAIDEATNQVIPVLTKSRYMIVRTNSTTNQTFELEPPAKTGVLQVSAKMNDKIIRANFVIQKANGEVIASRNNVTNSLFKLNTGSYKVSVSSGNNRDFKSVEVKAGESTQTVFTLKEAARQGKLLVRVFDTRSSNPLRADIKIAQTDGSIIQEIKAATQTELTLAPGNYKISVIGPNGTSNKNIKVSSGQSLSEVFRFDAPNTDTVDINENNNNQSTQINENVSIKPAKAETNTTVEPVPDESPVNNKSKLNIVALDDKTRKPIKSNIYVQTPAGKHLDKRTYVDGASFNLDPGVYKITVRANDRENKVKTIKVSANKDISETFLLVNPKQARNSNNASTNTIPKANEPKIPPTAIETGFLNVSMRAPRNQRINKNDLKTHFIVATNSGKKIVELTSVDAGNFKLDVGSYIVTAIYNNKRQQRRVNVRPNQNTRIAFITSNFLATKGVLRSRIIDETGKPLKGNLIVSNAAGQIVARSNNVSSAVFNLPPLKHTISVNIQGLSGSEVVNISPNETTVQTFTIAPNRPNNRNNPQNIKKILREKLEKEIRKQF